MNPDLACALAINAISEMKYCDEPGCQLRQLEIANNRGAHIHKPDAKDAIHDKFQAEKVSPTTWGLLKGS